MLHNHISFELKSQELVEHYLWNIFYPKNTQNSLFSECLLRLGVLCVCFVRAIFVMMPFNLTCLYYLQHSSLNISLICIIVLKRLHVIPLKTF